MPDDRRRNLELDEAGAESLPPAEDRERLAEQGAESEAVEGAVDTAGEAELLRREVADANEKYLRALADLENYRRRSQEERARQLQYGNEQLLRALLPVADDLERALASASAEDAMHRGVEMVLAKLVDAMGGFGAEPFSALGEQFDPYRHEAVECVPTQEFPENTVIREHQRGWMYRDRLLRPAMVAVATSPDAGQ